MTRKTIVATTFLLGAVFSAPGLARAERPPFGDVGSWAYQLTGYEGAALDRLADAPVDLLVIDLSRDGGEDDFRRDEVRRLQEAGKHVLAYFEVGAIEEYRPEWNEIAAELKAGAVSGWENEQYVRYWDERWWPVVRRRLDRAMEAGFDGAYLDMLTTYEEIEAPTLSLEERGKRMVALVVRVSRYAKRRAPGFKIVAQNSPELATGLGDETEPNAIYLAAIDGLALESPYYMAHDRPCKASWCRENRANALAVKQRGKLLLGVDYVRSAECRSDAYRRQREAGFVPYASVVELDRYVPEG